MKVPLFVISGPDTEPSAEKKENVGSIFWFHVPLSLKNSNNGDYVDRIFLIEF